MFRLCTKGKLNKAIFLRVRVECPAAGLHEHVKDRATKGQHDDVRSQSEAVANWRFESWTETDESCAAGKTARSRRVFRNGLLSNEFCCDYYEAKSFFVKRFLRLNGDERLKEKKKI